MDFLFFDGLSQTPTPTPLKTKFASDKKSFLAMLPLVVVVVKFQHFCKKYFMIIKVHPGCPK